VTMVANITWDAVGSEASNFVPKPY
jgi:hypothetical protein